ncbi:hypothetical protein OK016_19830 [Vibrio chagasii]|nr:hypothetical protein [Vibrio chagasii]
MLAIPLLFVAALLLADGRCAASRRRCHSTNQSKAILVYQLLCKALMVTVVGLRWTVDIALFRFLQPILELNCGGLVVLCGSFRFRSQSSTHLHWLGPIAVLVGSLFYTHLWASLMYC